MFAAQGGNKISLNKNNVIKLPLNIIKYILYDTNIYYVSINKLIEVFILLR